jgi:hypothetical protein
MRQLTSSALIKPALVTAQLAAGATNGPGVDCRGFTRATLLVTVGALAGDHNVTVKLQQSSDDGGSDAYADVASATTGAIAAAGDEATYAIEVDLSKRERYLRAVGTVAGTSTPVALTSAVFVLHRSTTTNLPPTQDKTVVSV